MKLFELRAIEDSLQAFLAEFPRINDRLAIRREELTPQMVDNIVEAYRFLNTLLEKEMDLFTPAGLHALVELNHIVLCGVESETREQYYEHLQETRRTFIRQIREIKDWVLKNRKESNPWRLATGFYSRALSRPQLFLEGNHRTGNIVLNYLLISRESPPYIVSVDTAPTYLDISGDIKFTENGNYLDTALRMPGHRKRFQAFLRDTVNPEFLCPR
ncbi:MAG: hypothetical protein EA427_05655 [Spirochaetaceae bacterium]|nr:MAG: hypothetical protein EA427_05655 [Spirochaetaceae bacterium]